MRRRAWFLGAALGWMAATAHAGTADADWKDVTALDAGPQQRAESNTAVRALVVAHLQRQETALRTFLNRHAADSRAFEARMRLARLLQLRGDFEDSPALRAEGRRLLEALARTATPEQRAEVDFAEITLRMREMRQPTEARREALLAAVRAFQTAHPADRRLAALLTETATLFDAQPRTKEALLTDAQRLASDEELRSRIADDLRRVRMLGSKISLSFTSVQGRAVRLEELRGAPVLVIFFAGFSPPSTAALAAVQRSLAELPAGSVHVLGISLDPSRNACLALLKARGLAWPVACDEKSWESPVVRGFGINALPTVWLLDREGNLRALNALEDTAAKVRALSPER